MTMVAPKNVRFKCADDIELNGDLYTPDNPHIAILISAGTGFPRRFYARIAQYLAAKGAMVLTFDYRGIFDDPNHSLKGSPIDYPDWGRKDQVAAVDFLAKQAPNLEICHIAHSVGGHFIGLMENHQRIARHAFISVGTGYWGHHHKSNWPKELYFWWVLGPYNLWRHGYIKPGGGWAGSPLPPKLFRTWRRWSSIRTYNKGDIQTRFHPHYYGDVTAPIRSWIFSDDPIATTKSGAVTLSTYPNAEAQIIERKPSDYGLKRIGHEGAFRKGREKLWDEIWEWFELRK